MMKGLAKIKKGIAERKSFPEYVKVGARALRNLSESIIMQSIEDLWEESSDKRRGSFAFFLGKGFHIWAELAGMTIVDRRTLLSLVLEAVQCRNVPEAVPSSLPVDREDFMA